MSPRKHDVPDELLSRLLTNYQQPGDLVGEKDLDAGRTLSEIQPDGGQ